MLYPHRINWVDGKLPVVHRAESVGINVQADEPLKRQCEHFVECITSRERPLSDAKSGIEVLKVLEAAQYSLEIGGKPQSFSVRAGEYFAHSSATIDKKAVIGAGSRVWHHSHVMGGARIGMNCVLGQNVFVGRNVTLGNHVKVQNNVSMYEGVELSDDVFCGPSMVFTNVINPRSAIERKDEFRKTIVERGVSFGANSTILCGTVIGEFAFIAAGAVVTKNVPPFGLVAGVPAKLIGWMCECGQRLEFSSDNSTCESCGSNYSLINESRIERAS